MPVDFPPRWMRAAAIGCALTVAVTFFSDLFVPAAREVEVWLGFEVTGPLALATAPLHWAWFSVATWAFWTGRAWIVPWAAAYLLYAAVSHLVWSEVSPHGRGWPIGLVQAVGIGIVACVVLRIRPRHGPTRGSI